MVRRGTHRAPELLERFVYGLPELFRDDLAGAEAVAVPGCYPTTANLALAPLVRGGLVEPAGIIVDAASGVSGAGRPPKPNTTFCTVDEDFTAYGLLDHRHTPEMEVVLGTQVLFTPHLAPMNRGILATCYARPAGGHLDRRRCWRRCTRPTTTSPSWSSVSGRPPPRPRSARTRPTITARHDQRTGWVVVICAIDNLVKGAAGQAVQCANLALGLPETAGLPVAGVFP